MDMIVAAGGGERDIEVDTGDPHRRGQGQSAPGFLNERLMNDLRPTLFLAQLSNLLAGNIAIVHGVCGTSRTFMGEEAASIDAARIALARIARGESDIALVGAAHNGERKDLMVLYEFGDFNLKDKYAPVWARTRITAASRSARPACSWCWNRASTPKRAAQSHTRSCQRGRRPRPAQAAGRDGQDAGSAVGETRPRRRRRYLISGSTGVEAGGVGRGGFLKKHPGYPVRSTGTIFGHTLETQFPLGIALAALSISRGALFPPNDSTGIEIENAGAPTQIVVGGAGHWQGEGLALVEAVK